jgi:hypothetical protein
VRRWQHPDAKGGLSFPGKSAELKNWEINKRETELMFGTNLSIF